MVKSSNPELGSGTEAAGPVNWISSKTYCPAELDISTDAIPVTEMDSGSETPVVPSVFAAPTIEPIELFSASNAVNVMGSKLAYQKLTVS